MKGIYENKLGVKIEVFETNKDIFGNKYITWRWCDDGRAYNVRIENFKNMIKINHFRKISR